MSIKEKALQTCTHIWELTEKTTNNIFRYVSEKSADVYRSEQLHNGLSKAKEFYNDNKEVCLIGATVATIWIVAKVTRQKDQSTHRQNPEDPKVEGEEEKEKEKKKKPAASIPIINKTFMDEEGVEFFPDEPSTDIVRRDSAPKKKGKAYEVSSEEDEKNDRIFFQMYSAYGVTSDDK